MEKEEENHNFMPQFSSHHVNHISSAHELVVINGVKNQHNNNNGTSTSTSTSSNNVVVEFPPGYRFCPSDGELIVYYLSKRINNEKLPHDRIKDVNIYKSNPHDLAANFEPVGDKEWYFFTPRDRKYRNGSRPNRAAGTGYWKATGADKAVKHNTERVGLRKALVFYQGKPPKGDKTNWIMHEYRIDGPQRIRTNSHDMRLDDWVLCRIYHKDEKDSKAREQNESSKEEQRAALVDDERMDNEDCGIENSTPVINTFGDHMQQQQQQQQPCLPNLFPPATPGLMDSYLFLNYGNNFHQHPMPRPTPFVSRSNPLMEDAIWDHSRREFINASFVDPYIHFDNIVINNPSCDPLNLLNNVTEDYSSDDYLYFETENPPKDLQNITSKPEEN